jgi:NADH-quinone oxidoreductase subunit E
VQERHGWISDDHLAEVATILEMITAELDGVATFYNLLFRRPVGRHVILLCDNIVCWILEQEKIRAQIRKSLAIDLGETSGDGKFTLLPVACLGACHHAPAMLVDGRLHESLTPETIEEILGRYE